MAIEHWLIVIGLLTLLAASLSLYNAMTANLRAGRLHQFMEHIEWRIILLERDVHRRLMKDGVPHTDLSSLHDIAPTFRDAERQMQEVFRRAQNRGLRHDD